MSSCAVGAKTNGFTKVSNLIARSPDLSLSAFRVFVFLRSFNPSFPSWERISSGTGIVSGSTISKAIAELERLCIVVKGIHSNGRSNSYVFQPEYLWKISAPKPPPKKQRHPVYGGGSLKICSPSSPEISHEDIQKMDTKKTTVEEEQVEEESTKEDSYINNRKTAPFKELKKWPPEAVEKFGNEIVDLFAARYNRQSLGSYPHMEELRDLRRKAVVQDVVEVVLCAMTSGGSMWGLVKNEFKRLGRQKTKHMPRTRFLINRNSIEDYQQSISDEWDHLDFPKAFGPLNYEKIKTVTCDDKTYQQCLATLDAYVAGADIREFELTRLTAGSELLVSLGPHVFRYVHIKDLLLLGRPSYVLIRASLKYFEETKVNLIQHLDQISFDCHNWNDHGFERQMLELEELISSSRMFHSEWNSSQERNGSHGQVRGHTANEIMHGRRSL